MDFRSLLMVAGEVSGDMHAARLLSEIRKLQPGIRAFGMGGAELREAGMEVLADSGEISVVGISEALKVLPRARKIFQQLVSEVESRDTGAAVLVDSPDFNLRLAKALKQRGRKIVYYISPQVWAWRKGRVRLISRVVDKMLVVLPFEVDFYRSHGIDATYVGHPLVDEVPRLEHVWDSPQDSAGPFSIALLPGSRKSEVESILPTLLESARELGQHFEVRLKLIKASSLDREFLETFVAASGLEVEYVEEDRFAALAASHLALCASGTATLEVGLIGTPMIVVYRVRPWTYLLGRFLVRLPNVSLVNLVLEDRVVEELIQGSARPATICHEAVRLLTNQDRIRRMRSRLEKLWIRLGESGASHRAAVEVVRSLEAMDR
ncbi:MAG: lipid-A-disaccharide synthase [Thermoanaerobaculia bacterium]